MQSEDVHVYRDASHPNNSSGFALHNLAALNHRTLTPQTLNKLQSPAKSRLEAPSTK